MQNLFSVILNEVKNLLQNLFSVILNEVKNLLREPGGVENRCGVPDPSLRLRLRSG